MILLDNPMSVFMWITDDSNDSSRCGKISVSVQDFDAYFFDFINCFPKIKSLSFLVCDDVLKSMNVMSKVVRLSAYDQDSNEQY
jgi:hypothetical protein